MIEAIGDDEPMGDNESDIAAGVVIGGGVSLVIGTVMGWSYRRYVRKKGRRSWGQLLIGPNGCTLVYTF
jgi:hypothetical protein